MMKIYIVIYRNNIYKENNNILYNNYNSINKSLLWRSTIMCKCQYPGNK